LNLEIDLKTLKKATKLIKNVRDELDENPLVFGDLDFHSFKARNHQQYLASIDGSHFSLKGGSFVFSAIRSGFHLYRQGVLTDSSISQVKIEILTKDNYKKRHREYFRNVIGDLPQGTMEYEKATERIRTILEWDKIKYLVDSLSEGDIILFDGSLISGVISTNNLFFDEICTQAKLKGIILAGLSKDSTITKNNVPVTHYLNSYTKKNKIDGNWYVHLEKEDTFFVKFRSHLDQIFRLDLVLPEGVTEKDAISLIGSYCYDPGTPAYPFPLLTIHDSVRISENQFSMILETFKNNCLEQGVSQHFVNQLFEIYHNTLDVYSSGR
jgi:hypothetical protein